MIVSMLIAGVVIAFIVGWMLALACTLFIPILIFCWTKSLKFRSEASNEEDKVYRECDAQATESFAAIKLIKQMNAEDF